MLGISASVALGLATVGVAASSTFASTSAKLPTAISASKQKPGPAPRPGRRHHPMFGGIVVSATSSTLNVRSVNDVTRSYTLTSSTRYLEGGTKTTSQALRAGEHVHVVTSPGSTTVKAVRIIEPRVVGVIVGISGNTVTTTGRSGLDRVIYTTASTIYHESGTTVSQSSLKVGELISAVGTPTASQTSLDASKIAIHLPSYAGTVASISGNTFTLKLRSGVTATINVNGATSYHNGAATSSLSAIKEGTFVVAKGLVAGTNTMTATRVQLGRRPAPLPPVAPGKGSGPSLPA